MADSKTAPGAATGGAAPGRDDPAASLGGVDKALGDLPQASGPPGHQVVKVLNNNLDPLTAAAKDLLTTADQHSEPLLTAGARLASTGARQAISLGQSTGSVSSPPARPGAGTTGKSSAGKP